MKLLLFGGTGFLSGHLVSAALAQGHEVTLFHRGKTNPERFPDVEHILGDREHDLELLRGRHWDAAIDPCGYLPRIVEASSTFLAPIVEHYTFISSGNAYADFGKAVVVESSPLATLPDGASEEISFETYGPYKVLCEQAAERAMPGRVLNVRAGLMVGPADASGRFTYWPRRIARGGEILAPGARDKDLPVEIIDARDVANWIISMIERRQAGIYNAAGPSAILTLQSLLGQAATVIGSEVEYTWVSDAFLVAHKVASWTELPLWVPQEEEKFVIEMSSQKAVDAGLTYRPLAQTILDTLAWDTAHPDFPVSNATLTAEKEQSLLREWHTQQIK